MTSPIPLIDFASGQTRDELAQAILSAVTSVGFVHVKGLPGLSQEAVNGIFAVHKELYDSPVEERAACPADETRNGWQALRGMRLGEKGGGADVKEAFVFGHGLPDKEQPLPAVLEKNREVLRTFHATCHEAFSSILDLFSSAMNLPATFFRDAHALGNNSVSLINYPPLVDGDAGAGETRAGAHKDWGTITMLFQEENGTPGLEVFLPDADAAAERSDKPYVLTADTDLSRGRWVPAPIVAGSVLINVGLALETWTNGLYKATLHRVVFPSTEGSFAGRRSIAFFSQPRLEVVLNPVKPDGSVEVTPGALTSKEFFIERMRAAAY